MRESPMHTRRVAPERYTLVGLLSTVAGHCRPYRTHAHCGGDCALAALPPPVSYSSPTSDMCVAQQICGMGAPTRSPDLALIQCVAQHQRCMHHVTCRGKRKHMSMCASVRIEIGLEIDFAKFPRNLHSANRNLPMCHEKSACVSNKIPARANARHDRASHAPEPPPQI